MHPHPVMLPPSRPLSVRVEIHHSKASGTLGQDRCDVIRADGLDDTVGREAKGPKPDSHLPTAVICLAKSCRDEILAQTSFL